MVINSKLSPRSVTLALKWLSSIHIKRSIKIFFIFFFFFKEKLPDHTYHLCILRPLKL